MTSAPFPLFRLLVISGAIFVCVSSEFLPTGLLPDIAAELNVSESQVGLLVTIFAGTVVLSTAPLTVLTRRFEVAADWPYRLVRAEVDLDAGAIRFHGLRRRQPDDGGVGHADGPEYGDDLGQPHVPQLWQLHAPGDGQPHRCRR